MLGGCAPGAVCDGALQQPGVVWLGVWRVPEGGPCMRGGPAEGGAAMPGGRAGGAIIGAPTGLGGCVVGVAKGAPLVGGIA